jgi:hypothetical protein
MAQSAVTDHNRLQLPRLDGDWNELSELPWDASQEWRKVVNASLESYEEDEARRAAREAKLEAQEQSDLVSAAGASIYEGKRDRVEQAATSVHMATQFAVMRTRHDRATGDEESDRRKEAHQEEERNQAQRGLVEQRRKAANRVRSAVMPLIDAKRAQSEDGKGKGRSRPWQATLLTCALEAVSPDELIKRAWEAGMDEVELQQALSLLLWAPSGTLTNDDFTFKTDCSVCHMVKTTALWVWQKSAGCSADGSAQMVLERTIICEACYTRVCIDGGMYIDGGWWRFVAADC